MKAILVVDMQHDFVLPSGALAVPNCDQLAAAVDFEADRYPLKVFTKCWHPEKDPSFQESGGPWPAHCLRGSFGAELLAGLKCKDEADLILHKVGYSAFFNRPDEATGLYGYLRDLWVDELRIVGVALDYCVKATALDAAKLGFGVSVSLAATRAVFPETSAKVIEELRKEGVGIAG